MIDARERVRRLLREHTRATLLADEVPFRAMFVIDSFTGSLVTAVPRLVLDATDLVMMIPEESAAALQIMGGLQALAESRATDRHQAYHGRNADAMHAVLMAEAGKLGGAIVESHDLLAPNPFAGEEARLCKLCNANPGRVARVLASGGHTDAPPMVVVGIDDLGVDVRTRFGIVRLWFSKPALDAEAAVRELFDLDPGTREGGSNSP
ncbi:MAG: hypothetical protein SFZ23_10690 [Planctomycetota bacterium]|nr:hypothetical protein [Planctomycetota bacterium]